MIPTLEVKNSFSRLLGFPTETMQCVDEVLTYQNDIQAEKLALIKKMNYFKRFIDHESPAVAAKARKNFGWMKKQLKELLASEYVKWLDGDRFPTGHLNIVKDVLAEIHPKFDIVDHRIVPERQHDFVLCKDFPKPRYYQEEMHDIGMREQRGVFESAVGTGKSLVLMRLLFELGVTSLIVVPSKPLLNQLRQALEEHFGKRNVLVAASASVASKAKLRKLKKVPIRLINIQALASLNKKGDAGKILQDVNAIFIDEIHHAGSRSYTALLEEMEHIYYRFGFTGTFLRNDSKTLDMWGFLSTKLYTFPAWRAIEEGFLTSVTVVEHRIEGVRKGNYQREYDANYCGGQAILERIREILTNHVKKGEQVLILVNRKDKAGLVIHEYLDDLGFDNTYISGDTDKDEVDSALSDFNSKRVKILIGSQVIGEGIDIRSTDHLIMAQGGKSEIAIVQAAGRLVRLFPGKSMGFLHDFLLEDTKYLEKHYKMRKVIYKNNLASKFVVA